MEAPINAALAATGNVNLVVMDARPRISGVRLMKPKKCEAARPTTTRKALQMAATMARMTETTKLAMRTRGVQMAAAPARKTSMKEVPTAATVPRAPVIRKGLLMAATQARKTDVAKVAASAKEVQTTAGMMNGSILRNGIVGFEDW